MFSVIHAVPAQSFGGEVPEGHGAVTSPAHQEGGVRRQCADSERAALRVLQRRQQLAGVRPPQPDGAVRGAAEQEAAAGAEAAAVDPVAVARQRRVRKLGEVRRVVNAKRFISRAGHQEGLRQGAAADLVRVMSKSAN